jgi:hypothetical protein
MVESLNGQAVGRYRLHVEIVGRPRYVDQRDFALYLIDPDGRRSQEPLFRGRWNAGRPSSHVPTWIDGEFAPVPFPLPQDEGEQLREGESLFGEVAQSLGALIPAGGRLWLAYESFGTENWLYCETRAALAAQVPAEATPIGRLLVRAGCWSGIRDWDFPEGGREGYRKLQGNKPLHLEHAYESGLALMRALHTFAAQRASDEVTRRARVRASLVQQELEQRIARRDVPAAVRSIG